MPNNVWKDNVVSGASLGDYLLSIADGIARAQEQLNRLQVAGQPGQASIIYQMPRVDFELKLSFDVQRTQTQPSPAGAAPGIAVPESLAPRLILLTQPVNAANMSERSNTSGVSTVRGSFVSVPAYGGKPAPILQVAIHKQDQQVRVEALVNNTLDEALSNVEVHFNIDRDTSSRLTGQPLRAGTRLTEGVVWTDERGIAATNLRLDGGDRRASVAIMVDAIELTEMIIYKENT